MKIAMIWVNGRDGIHPVAVWAADAAPACPTRQGGVSAASGALRVDDAVGMHGPRRKPGEGVS